jgi:hypothetical protein
MIKKIGRWTCVDSGEWEDLQTQVQRLEASCNLFARRLKNVLGCTIEPRYPSENEIDDEIARIKFLKEVFTDEKDLREGTYRTTEGEVLGVPGFDDCPEPPKESGTTASEDAE